MKTWTEDRRFCSEGVEVLRIRLRLSGEGMERDTEEWYRAMLSLAERFGEERLLPRAESSYLHSEDEKKRFRFQAFLYRVEASCWERDGLCAVRLEATLRRRGEEGTLSRFIDGQVWDGARLLPPAEGILRLYGSVPPRRSLRGADGWYFRGHELFVIRRGVEERLDFYPKKAEKY